MNKNCFYPDWEKTGNFFIREHRFDSDGFCNICGERSKVEIQESMTRCQTCNNKGYILAIRHDGTTYRKTCPTCKGECRKP